MYKLDAESPSGPKGGCFLKVEEQNTEFCEFKIVEEIETQLYKK